ncbi:zn-dependent exopeptidase [Artemisia annua]|uniref:aspartyl aminopeptidase n=1 Tax=Artemisia annua TaxID=35608 RepID=A0A2U1QMC9_ARTAN|nr:zn-dependent exopeptidase [Artemisia annua]
MLNKYLSTYVLNLFSSLKISFYNFDMIPELLDCHCSFISVFENDEWNLKPGGRYFFTRNMSCLVAFAIGEKYTVGNGFHVIAAHTDSPCLKLKPKSASSKSNYLMVNVQTYGGGLWHTWFDRDLSVAGRVIVRSGDGSFLHKLVKVKRPLLRVPTLAIHLDRNVNKDGFKPNLETHLNPLLATKHDESSSESKDKSSSKDYHHPLLMQILSDELGCEVDDIASIELNICDTQPSCLGGANDEFIFSGRLDNLASSFCALRALVDSSGSKDLSDEHAIRMVALFDNEEEQNMYILAHSDCHYCICYSNVNKDGFKPNLETHLNPLLATKHDESSSESKDKSSSKDYHHPLLMQILSDELGCEVDDIASIELNICDTQPSCLGGANDEFIFSGRLDNLASSFCALRALVDSSGSKDLSDEHAIRMVALFDNEEVGSDSIQGAGAPTMFQAMRRIIDCLANSYVREGMFERAIRQSFLVSADMAHGVHPNFMDKHEEHHRPELHKGLVIKHNANQRYATSGITAFLFKEVAKIHNLPTQDFVVRNDMGCGSTIGPILASGIGIRTVDCGIPQLSMHSVREVCGKEDVDLAYKHFKAFYQTFSSVDKKLNVD